MGELQLFVRLPAGHRVSVEVAPDATVGQLREEISRAGGPAPAAQLLLFRGADLPDSAALADVGVCMQSAIDVSTRAGARTLAWGLNHGVYVTAGGGVSGWGPLPARMPVPALTGPVTSVYAGSGVSAAVAGGRMSVWGTVSGPTLVALAEIRDVRVSSAALSATTDTVAAVDVDGRVHLLPHFPERLQGSVADVALSASISWVLTRAGAVFRTTRAEVTEMDTGGRRAVHIAAGPHHCAAVTEDGGVVCFGLCASTPSDVCGVVAVACGVDATVAVLSDGSVRQWGIGPALDIPASAGRCCAVASGYGAAVATESGSVFVLQPGRLSEHVLPEAPAASC
eukprot:TRINITY_DN9349_c2_g1_i1.p1 TRINITY_DN9349_c2_g1~~TRINITY_DN9349_c2_g1_i1.p1  ORF type:complete len:378 (+),score=108.21 TRINITY_DN9349_c2_g1_i1:116-1135(+)